MRRVAVSLDLANINTLEIRSAQHELYKDFAHLYEQSFPIFEQRTQAQQEFAFTQDQYHLQCFVSNGSLLGFIAFWDLDACWYIEHLAIAKELRGQGYGQALLISFINKSPKSVLLEIDPLVDDIARARLRFYQHCGFMQNNFEHRHPPYLKDFKAHQLIVLTTKGTISQPQYQAFNHDLCTLVMQHSPQ